MNDNIIEMMIREYESLKGNLEDANKDRDFYWKQLYLIIHYLEDHKPNPERAFLYKIFERFWDWLKVKWSWSFAHFWKEFYSKNMSIREDKDYMYERRAEKYVPDLYSNDKKKWD